MIDVDDKAAFDVAGLKFADRFGGEGVGIEATRLDGRVVDVWDGKCLIEEYFRKRRIGKEEGRTYYEQRTRSATAAEQCTRRPCIFSSRARWSFTCTYRTRRDRQLLQLINATSQPTSHRSYTHLQTTRTRSRTTPCKRTRQKNYTDTLFSSRSAPPTLLDKSNSTQHTSTKRLLIRNNILCCTCT